MSNYLKYTYSGSEDITVEEFIDTGLVDIDPQELLSYNGNEDENTLNVDSIFNKYSNIEQNKYNSEYLNLSSNLIIKSGTSLLLPSDKTKLDDFLLYSEGQFLKQGKFEFFLGDYEDLLSDRDYVRSQKISIAGSGVDIDIYNETIQVWVWVRAIDKIVDITPFVNNCITNKQSDIGSFNFSLNPVLDIDELIRFGDETLSYFPINGKKYHYIDFFEKNLQQNDVVFIRFEQLDSDKQIDSALQNLGTQYRQPFHLKGGRRWDMIGLIDSCNVGYSSLSTDKTLSVVGRDLMKLLVEDGSYFLPYKFIEGKDTENKFVWGGDKDDNWFKRNFISGNFDFFFSYEMKSIRDSLQFIINHLSNLGVTPDSLWQAYGDDRTKVYDINKFQDKAVNGVWQIIKLAIDENVEERVLVNDGLINPDGTLYEFFNVICQKPFVEFWGDTFTDTFDFIVRQPPFTRSAIESVVVNDLYIKIEESSLKGYQLAFDTTFYSHYQIEPQNQWAGTELGTWQAIIPIIYMPQFADTFGNKRYYVKDTYIDRISAFGQDGDIKFNSFIEGMLNDYKFLIETNAYLPFTRRGTITLNGDRRIKKGSFVINEATNELFYVEGVSNSFSVTSRDIDRTTTLTVSRGMKMNVLNKSIVTETNYSYFDIVDADLITSTILKKLNNEEVRAKKNTQTKFGVNEDAFNYFLNREHFV